MYIVVVLDWYAKKIAGFYIGMECQSRHWLEALDMAVNSQFPDGVREWTSPFELADALSQWISQYNSSYLHSALDYKSPNKFEEEYHNSQITLLVSA